jgi:hypothetical protein
MREDASAVELIRIVNGSADRAPLSRLAVNDRFGSLGEVTGTLAQRPLRG